MNTDGLQVIIKPHAVLSHGRNGNEEGGQTLKNEVGIVTQEETQ